MYRLRKHMTFIHLLELLIDLILKQNTHHITTLNTCWIYVWKQTANITDGSECFPQIIEEVLSSDPYRCKLSAVINKSKADIISSSAERQLVSARTLRTSAVIHRLCDFILFCSRLLIYAVSFTSSFWVPPFLWPRGPEISSYLPHVYCALFSPLWRAVGDAIQLFFPPIWWWKLIYASMRRRRCKRRFQGNSSQRKPRP